MIVFNYIFICSLGFKTTTSMSTFITNETSTQKTIKKATLPNRRLISVTGRRDQKLMTVLQSRRLATTVSPIKPPLATDCAKSCKLRNNDEYCKLKCSMDERMTKRFTSNEKNPKFGTPDSGGKAS